MKTLPTAELRTWESPVFSLLSPGKSYVTSLIKGWFNTKNVTAVVHVLDIFAVASPEALTPAVWALHNHLQAAVIPVAPFSTTRSPSIQHAWIQHSEPASSMTFCGLPLLAEIVCSFPHGCLKWTNVIF
ncbi:hypothetical protein ILYODFUR_013945 [Ilyodon furcidens]|uniref:Uncharacterized protein n=1 Tax=Ilyodon furcidens TaxID=33524 RepID=A0ABV0TUG0_9TELE